MIAQPETPPPGHLYLGEVMHHRLRPRRHRFFYRVAYLLVDLGRLAELDRRLTLFSVDRPNLVSFHQRDHGARDGSPLRPWVERQLADHGLEEAGGRILLLCMPRWLGHVFNPLSIYHCFDRQGRLAAVVYEVKNTFGEQHAYVLPVEPKRSDDGEVIRQGCPKALYVSPFMEMAARYRFRLRRPGGERLSVVIREDVAAEPTLVASLTGRRHPLTDRALLWSFLRHPTHKVLAGIHWEALRLWWKGLSLQPRPTAGADAVEAPSETNAGQLGPV
jgi:DUF1365 family protein